MTEKKPARSERQERLARQLRENIKRRKAQQRSRKQTPVGKST